MTVHAAFSRTFPSRACRKSLLVWLILSTLAAAQDKKQTFASSHGFSLQYPMDWEFRGRPSHFRIDNFPVSQWRKGSGLPPDGASIIVMVPRELSESKGIPTPSTLDQWVTLGTGSQAVESRRMFEIGESPRPLRITEVRTLCCAVPPFQESVTWYFAIGARLFSATLLRRQGEGTESQLRILREIVLSIRVKQSTSGG
jgi:hypothetical protein